MRSVAKIAAGGCALRVSWNQTEHFGRGRRETLPSAQLFGNNGVSFWLFQLFPAEKPGGFPVPRIRDRLHRIEHRALRTAAQGSGPEGSSIALSRRPPRRDTFAEAEARSASAPRTPPHQVRGRLWSRCALRTGRILTSSQLFRRSSTTDWAASSLTPAFHSRAACGIGTATPDQASQWLRSSST